MNILKIILIVVLFSISNMTAFAQEEKIQLLWKNAEDAVMYELVIANAPIDTNNPIANQQLVYRTTEVFTPGIELSLSLFKDENLDNLYYRVRPLNLDKEPIDNFSDPVALSDGDINPTKPRVTAMFNSIAPVPLYPVYSWIPVLGAERYEVEITNRRPENPNGVEPSKYRINYYSIEGGFDCYDTNAYTKAGKYYWRVRAFDAQNQPLGTYSDAISFRVKTGNYKWAAFGDSITHGGGAVSNPPSDERFAYLSYLPFPVKNLGKSGDTAEMLVDRFETDVLPFKPKYMFVLGGTNSIRGGATGEQVIASLEIVREKCEVNKITPIFLTLPPLNPERIQIVFNQPTAENWQAEIAKVNDFIKTQRYFVDVNTALKDEKGILPVKYAEDGLHPDISGKMIMADSINEFLKEHKF